MNRLTTCTATFFLILSTSVAAQSPVLPIQGTLREMAGNLVNDTRSVTFRLYGEDSGGTAFYTVTKDVSFTNGQFVVYLGDQGDDELNPADFEGLPQVWLGIEVSPETVEMTPRVRLGTSPFALYAAMCGEAQTAQQANASTTANGLSCSGCVSLSELDTSTRNQFAQSTHTHSANQVTGVAQSTHTHSANQVTGVATSGHGHPSTDVTVTPTTAVTNNGQIFFSTTKGCVSRDAAFCALTAMQYRDGNQSGDSYCSITLTGSTWELCARGNGNANGAYCSMACIP
jgi:hypothetical protein